MTGPASRRAFLSGLVSLPLIGGGVTLIGSPIAVAEPASDRLLREYANWLAYERFHAQKEAYGDDCGDWYSLYGAAYRWHEARGNRQQSFVPPSTRAALVLATVGCDWRESGR